MRDVLLSAGAARASLDVIAFARRHRCLSIASTKTSFSTRAQPGSAGYRTPYLAHAKRTLYHVSYGPVHYAPRAISHASQNDMHDIHPPFGGDVCCVTGSFRTTLFYVQTDTRRRKYPSTPIARVPPSSNDRTRRRASSSDVIPSNDARDARARSAVRARCANASRAFGRSSRDDDDAERRVRERARGRGRARARGVAIVVSLERRDETHAFALARR